MVLSRNALWIDIPRKMADEGKGLDSFLNKVGEIETLIKDLTAADDNTHKDAIDKADKYLKQFGSRDEPNRKKYPPQDNTGVNRTVINHAAFQDDSPPPGPSVHQGMSQDSFMNALEADAKERHERKQKSENAATVLKNQGNEHFNKGDYQKAVEFYTKALDQLKDMSALWTNRAQAYIRLGEFDKALEDCDWALRVSTQCLKAYIHQGKAYVGKQQYDQAITSYEQAKQIEPKKSNVIDEYISEANRLKESHKAEIQAAEIWNTGNYEARGVVDILEKLAKSDMPPLYYSGGLRLLAHTLSNTTEKTLFRSHGGLDLMHSHAVISKTFSSDVGVLTGAELDLAVAVLDTLTSACTDNETNCCQLFDKPGVPEIVQKVLSSTEHPMIPVREAVLKLLHTASLSDAGRAALVKKCDMPRVLLGLFELMKLGGSVAVTAAGFLNNLALNKRFQTQLRPNIDQGVIPAWEKLIVDGASNKSVLPACISIMTNLCGDPHIRHQMVGRKETWKSCCHCLETYTPKCTEDVSGDILHEALGLVLNLTYEPSQNAKDNAKCLSALCLKLLLHAGKAIQQRSLSVLAHLLPLSEDATSHVCNNGLTAHLFELIKNNEDQMKNAVKCLTACSQNHVPSRSEIVRNHLGIQQVVELVKHRDETVVGNAALCLSNCITEEGLAASLTETNVIMDLLVVARDARRHAAQYNCAILIAKLAQAHTGHLERLRDLHGLEILHDVLKHTK